MTQFRTQHAVVTDDTVQDTTCRVTDDTVQDTTCRVTDDSSGHNMQGQG